MSINKESILKIVNTIRESDVKNKEQYFEKIYMNFKNKYPNLYAMACKENVNMNILHYMLDMLDKINANEKTQEEASLAVGQELFTNFVDVSKLQKSDEPVTGGPKIVIK